MWSLVILHYCLGNLSVLLHVADYHVCMRQLCIYSEDCVYSSRVIADVSGSEVEKRDLLQLEDELRSSLCCNHYTKLRTRLALNPVQEYVAYLRVDRERLQY
jgi:hypothetical protein